MMPPPAFHQLLERHGLSDIAADLLASSKPSLRLLLQRDDAAPLTSSRFGGLAAFDRSQRWPTKRDGAPLSFLGQIDCGETAQYEMARQLPPGGILSFFYDVEEQPWGDFEEKDGWRVLYSPDPPAVEVMEAPPSATTLPSCRATFVEELTFPAPRSIELDRLPLDDDTSARYFDFRDALLDSLAPGIVTHRLLGHPDAIQGCMQRTLQFESRNEQLPDGIHSYYEHPRAEELIPGSFQWQLLLQLDSDDELGTMWGDAGRIFFWMPPGDLAARKFDDVWLQLQCY